MVVGADVISSVAAVVPSAVLGLVGVLAVVVDLVDGAAVLGLVDVVVGAAVLVVLNAVAGVAVNAMADEVDGAAILAVVVGAVVFVLVCVIDGTELLSLVVGAAVFPLINVVFLHTVVDIDPDDPRNMSRLSAIEWTQAAPQSICLKDRASKNIPVM